MSKTARVPEPSMEEILASIRRIIADDSGNAGQPGAAAAQKSPALPQHNPNNDFAQNDADALLDSDESSAETDVLELTTPVEPGEVPSFTPIRGPDVIFRAEEPAESVPPLPKPVPATQAPASAAQAPDPAPAPRAPAAAAARAAVEDRLLSPDSTAAVSAAFNSLASTVLSENARTLEDIVKDMMRPMLKEWLDENLPGLVERIVRAEIERVARGGR